MSHYALSNTVLNSKQYRIVWETLLCPSPDALHVPVSQSEDDEAYADDTPLVALLGDTARIKLLSVFVGKRDREFTISELADDAGITRKSVYEHLDDLLALGVAREIDTGGSSRYTTAETDVAEKLFELDGVTLQRLVEVEGE